jgi:uncharacterized lipoprotein YajG
MKTTKSPSKLLSLLAALCALLVFTGCAGMDAGNQKSLLTAAGFRAR